MADAFSQLARGRARVPARVHLESDAGLTLVMPAWLPEGAQLGTKLVSLFPENASRGQPIIQGIVALLDGRTGRPRAVLDGTHITALRTAAASGLATRLLAPDEPAALALYGAGVQARAHVDAMCAVRPIREIRIVSRTRESAERLAAELAASPESPSVRVADRDEALDGAGIVVAATTSETPVFDGSRVELGTHINAVGSFRPTMQEVDEIAVRRSRVVVDTREGALEEAGDLIIPIENGLIDASHIDAELGEVVDGVRPGGREGHELTLFKSVGNAAQDVAIGAVILRAAEAAGIGRTVPFGPER